MLVHPPEMVEVARSLRNDTHEMRAGLGRLRSGTDRVGLQPADPGLADRIAARQAAVLSEFERSAAALADVADELESAAAAAVAADLVDGNPGPGRPPICRLPDGLLGTIDRWLTAGIGAGLTALTVGAVEAVDWFGTHEDPVSGDAGGRFSTRSVPFPVSSEAQDGAPPPARLAGVQLIAGSLEATADETVLAHDEFGLIDHGGRRYTIVLPGVTDLSRPQRGWNPVNRSPRDLDMAALASSRSARVGDNAYAGSVADALIAIGIPDGAELMIIGHSFGADTALDLAADPGFTDRYRLTHVVATGSFSQPQPASLPPGTATLAVQNRQDVVAQLGSLMPTAETGTLDCADDRTTPSRASVVRFDGGFGRYPGGFGHPVSTYRSVFTGQVGLSTEDRSVVDRFLRSVDERSPVVPPSMMAVDISLPE